MCALHESGFERTHRIGLTVFSDFPLFEPGRLICSRIPSLKAGCMVEICRIDKSMRLDVARTPWPCPSGFLLCCRDHPTTTPQLFLHASQSVANIALASTPGSARAAIRTVPSHGANYERRAPPGTREELIRLFNILIRCRGNG